MTAASTSLPNASARWRRSRRPGAAALAVLAALSFAPVPAHAEDPDLIALSLGAFDINDSETSTEVRFEYRSDAKFAFLKPFAGVMFNHDSAVHFYGGALLDLYWGKRFVTTFSIAPGGYVQADSKDLGSVFQLRSQIELGYRFDDRSRLALSLSHMSNAGIADDNQGTQSVMLTYAVPFDRVFGD